MKRRRVTLTDEVRAAIDELVPPERQTGVPRHDLTAASDELIERRRKNTELGRTVYDALHEDSGSWTTVAYLCGLKRSTVQRWGKKVMPDDAGPRS
jgi:hypothetical protein